MLVIATVTDRTFSGASMRKLATDTTGFGKTEAESTPETTELLLTCVVVPKDDVKALPFELDWRSGFRPRRRTRVELDVPPELLVMSKLLKLREVVESGR